MPLDIRPLLKRIAGAGDGEPSRASGTIDPLTRLPTREAVVGELKRLLGSSHRKHAVGLAIVDFSNVQGLVENGESVDPDLLARLARLMTTIAAGHMVGHMRDREFAVILKDTPVTEVEHLADEIIGAVRSDASLAAERRYIATFVGVGYSSLGGCNPHELMALADIALHYALATGRGCHVIVDRVPSSRVA